MLLLYSSTFDESLLAVVIKNIIGSEFDLFLGRSFVRAWTSVKVIKDLRLEVQASSRVSSHSHHIKSRLCSHEWQAQSCLCGTDSPSLDYNRIESY
jgi:hypothetical protein